MTRSRDVVNSHPPAHHGQQRAPSGLAFVAAILAALCALGLVVLSALVGSGPLPVDVAIRGALHVGEPVPLPLAILNVIGGALIWDPMLAVIVAALWLGGRRLEALWIGAGALVAEALATGIKLVVDRPRPPGIAVIDLVTQASFPSGHVTRVVVTAALIAIVWPAGPRTRIAATIAVVALGILIGLARIVAGEHWPTDVAGAYLLAGTVIAGALAIRLWLTTSRPAPLPQRAAPSDGEAPRP